MLDVRKLRMLLAVAEHGGVAAAARALSFTPPAVSQQLAALERQLSLTLVDRAGRTAVLTPAGQQLAGHARGVIAALEQAESELMATGGSVSGVVRVATIATLGRVLLPAVLAHLARSCPGVDLRVEQLEPEQSLPALARGELDLVLAGEYALTPRRLPSTLERIDLGTETVHVAVPHDHALAGPNLHLAELREARWIAPEASTSCSLLVERACALVGYEPHVVARCGDFSVAAALVGAGHGVAMLPAVAAPLPGSLPVRLLTALDPPITRSWYAAIRRGTSSAPPLAHLLAAVTDAAGRFTGAREATRQPAQV